MITKHDVDYRQDAKGKEVATERYPWHQLAEPGDAIEFYRSEELPGSPLTAVQVRPVRVAAHGYAKRAGLTISTFTGRNEAGQLTLTVKVLKPRPVRRERGVMERA